MPFQPAITFSGLYERDIDLLLLEEFYTNPKFTHWFLGHLPISNTTNLKCVSVHHSATTRNGESDIELTFEDSEGLKLMVLIENKVNAQLQPRQAERYIERGEEYLATGKCQTFHTALIAPKQYLGTSEENKGFESAITYEQMADWILTQPSMGLRGQYKASLLTDGSKKIKSSADDTVTNFWQRCWELTRIHFPDLVMNEPRLTGRTAISDFITMIPPELPEKTGIVYKFAGTNKTRPMASVDIQIGGVATNISKLESKVSSILQPEMIIAEAGKSASIRILTPALDPRTSTDEEILQGLKIADTLHRWYKKHQDLLNTLIHDLRSKQLTSNFPI